MHAGHNKTNEVSVTTFDFPDNETTTFWVGTEEGNVYQANRYDRAGAKAGLHQSDIYRGHAGPVMGLHFHPLIGSVDFSDYFLTCSVDWTVKLWRKSTAKPSNTTLSISYLYSFDEADDYVYDVKWHPSHPAVFGTVDGSGKFDLWNLNMDTEVRVRESEYSFSHTRRPPRFPWCLPPWGRIAPSTNLNGTGRMVAEQGWVRATVNYTSMTLEIRRYPESRSGLICSVL